LSISAGTFMMQGLVDMTFAGEEGFKLNNLGIVTEVFASIFASLFSGPLSAIPTCNNVFHCKSLENSHFDKTKVTP